MHKDKSHKNHLYKLTLSRMSYRDIKLKCSSLEINKNYNIKLQLLHPDLIIMGLQIKTIKALI